MVGPFARASLLLAPLLMVALPYASVPVQSSHPGNPLQPGDLATTPVGQCTLDFVFDGLGANAGKTFLGIAAHCINGIGDPVSAIGYTGFGTIQYLSGFMDFALIEVGAANAPHVSAAVKGHPGKPTGFTTAATTAVGDVLQLSGYGIGYSATQVTQEKRVGVLVSDGPTNYCAVAPAIFGDSGGPVLHMATGRALGIVNALSPFCPLTGVSVEGVLNQAAVDGFPVALRTA